ncbi:MAG: hypothetical protein GKR97_03905 [Rhizobiaceae bacterium]|nr:hypothetical protein [Rhizobiaceae bacterium]
MSAPIRPHSPTSPVAAIRAATAAAAVAAVAGCSQTTTTKPEKSPQSTMVGVAKQVQSCWFAKNDPALKGYSMAPEVNSYSGKPRILIVPRNNPAGLPKLVAQAERFNGRTSFTTFGPLLATADGPRLEASLRAWAQGSRTC